MAKLKPDQLLQAYRGRDEFAEIARAAARWVSDHPRANRQELLSFVAATFGPPPAFKLAPAPAPLTIFGAVGTQIPANAQEQMEMVLRLPMATRGALMPDAHLGYAMPIGGVAVLVDAISPSFVGYDISCMVMLTILDLPPAAFMADRPQLADVLQQVTAFGLGADFPSGAREHPVMDDALWRELPILHSLHRKAQTQLGSSGGGNHFADLVVIDFLQDEETHGFGRGDRVTGLLTHSGSRGTGYQVAKHYVALAGKLTRNVADGIPRGYEWLELSSEPGQEYMAAMELMGRYALANHTLIHDHFVAETGLGVQARIWNRHNFAWLDQRDVIHRKGATPAETGQLGLIPGTSGTASYLVRGLGNAASVHSSAHGAGRTFSRTEAKRRHDAGKVARHMRQEDILHFGLAPDESFMAYKDIEMVMEIQEGVLIESVARMMPKVVIMGGQADDGD